ncbi:sugar transferase [Ruminococcus sp. CLA-AA-H200]|uniref:Sugar transferase n=1 Tax=Ruminococcus turbiniformis TaxID=2881258 RepID=A0ABS8FVR1_9FIRM|nr:sugar transferase [Ruminococcus turbiniformis]MCC2254136.1 sugar transferase [Ruminococcus turbiniformis]
MKPNQLEQYKRILRIIAALLVIASVSLAFFFIWTRYYNLRIVFPFYYKGHWVVMAIYVILLFVFFYIYGGLKFGYLKSSSVILSQIIAVVCANVLMYLQISLLSAELEAVVPFLYLTCADFLIIVFWTLIINKVFARLFPPRKLLILYDEYEPQAMLKKMKVRNDRYEIGEVRKVWTLSQEKFEYLAKKYDAVLIYDLHSELRNKILKYCYSESIRVYSTSKISDILVKGAENIHLFDTPILLFRNYGLTFEQKLVKRIMDIVMSSIILVITSPIMLIVAAAIKLYDGGPVMFRQERCTINGKVFRIHKFRSMIVDAEKEGKSIPATDNDPRITPVGRFIRKTRLDELPQMIDILNGNMSMVGPRPERVEHVKKYTEEIAEFDYRLKVKGGLTGYAQIYGKYNTTPYDKLKLDLMYIQNYSVLMDLRLILMTVKIMFMKESTEGFEEKEGQKAQEKEEK